MEEASTDKTFAVMPPAPDHNPVKQATARAEELGEKQIATTLGYFSTMPASTGIIANPVLHHTPVDCNGTQITLDIRSFFLVLAQGGWVLDQGEGDYLRGERLSGRTLASVLSRLESAMGPLSVMVEVLEHDGAPLWGDLDPTWRYPVAVEPRSRAECVGNDVIKAFVRSPSHQVDDLLAAAERIVPPEMAFVTQAGLNFVEICPPGVDKGSGLAVVAQAVGVDPADVLVFGDMPNDLPMFAWAGWARVAVANAHPSVLAAADEVTLSNDEDGVAVYLDRILSR